MAFGLATESELLVAWSEDRVSPGSTQQRFPGALLGQIQEEPRHLPVSIPAQVHVSQGVALMGIEARGNH